jgi:hypothetical protein
MPQGRAKKIQVQLLPANFSLEFLNPFLGLHRVGDIDRARHRHGRRRVEPRWPANTTQ